MMGCKHLKDSYFPVGRLRMNRCCYLETSLRSKPSPCLLARWCAHAHGGLWKTAIILMKQFGFRQASIARFWTFLASKLLCFKNA